MTDHVKESELSLHYQRDDQPKDLFCVYKHHKEYGQKIVCDCGEPMLCGPFHHACPVCDTHLMKKCVCGSPIVYCCC